jgi:hypothetical protein
MNNFFLKTTVVLFCVLAFALSFQGRAEAGEAKVPQFIQEYYEDHDLKMANFVWFPFTAASRTPTWPWNWETYIIVSNFEANTITVNAWATNWGDTPTIKVITLAPYEKRILRLQDWGFFNTIADIWLTSGSMMGAAAIIFDAMTNELLTALPPIDR